MVEMRSEISDLYASTLKFELAKWIAYVYPISINFLKDFRPDFGLILKLFTHFRYNILNTSMSTSYFLLRFE